jgi:hypothetical protein
MKNFQARIFADTFVDDYSEGEGARGTSWENHIYADSIDELLTKIEDLVDVKRTEWEVENINGYEDATEIFTCATVNENNDKASQKELSAWKRGKKTLWACHYHILVSEVTLAPVEIQL